MTRFIPSILAAAAALAAVPVSAAPAVTLEGDVRLETTVTENGTARVVLSEPKVVVPGNQLLFVTRYHNEGPDAVSNFVVTSPIPEAVVLRADGSDPLEVSVDQAHTWGQLATLKVADGKGGLRPAAATDVTHVRWLLPTIAAGAEGAVQYHAIVR